MLKEFCRKRSNKLTIHNANERLVAAYAATANLHRTDIVHRVFSSSIIFKSHHTCAYTTRRILSYAL